MKETVEKRVDIMSYETQTCVKRTKRMLIILILKTMRKKITSINVFSFTKRNSAPCEQLVVMCDAYIPA